MKDSVTRNLLRQAALDHGYAVSKPGDDEYFLEVTHPSGQTALFRGTLSNRNSATGSLISRRKDLTLDYLSGHGIQVPPYAIYEPGTANNFLDQHKPIVVKPSDAAQSKGITVDINDQTELEAAVAEAQKYTRNGNVILQKQIYGKLYRLIVVNNKLVGVALRKAAEVTGDGNSTVRQLIELLNQDPRRSDGPDTPLKLIPISSAEAYLGKEALDNVPQISEVVRVSAIDSVSAGGESVDVTDEVHPKHREIAESLARNLDLYVCGYDIIAEDIALPPPDDYWPFLELNSSPGLKLHHFPTGGGKPRDIASLIIDQLF